MSQRAAGGRPSRRGLLAAAGTIAVITLVARIVGFGRWFAFSHSVGATCVGSVYQSVNAVPNVLFEIAAGGVLAAVAVPLVATSLARGDRSQADATASALLTWAVVVLVPLAIVVTLAARPIAGALLGTGCAGEVALGAELLVVFAVQIPLYGVAIVLAGVLQSHQRFVGAAVAPLLSSLVVIATYLLYRSLVPLPAAAIADVPTGAVAVLGVGTTLGVVALGLPLLVPVRRAGIRLRARLRFPQGAGRRVRALALAGLLAVAGQQLATLVVIRIANDRGGPGTLNVYTYAQAVTLLPYAVLAVPLATAAFPSLAGAHAASSVPGGAPAAEATLRRAWLATVVVSLFGAAALVAVAVPVGSFFQSLDAGSGSQTSLRTLAAMGDAVTLFAPSVVALAVIGLLARASYVRGAALAAGALAAAGWLATAVMPLLLLDPAGASGPATVRALGAGSSLGLALGAVLLVVLVGRTWGWAALSLPPRPLVAALTGSVVAAGTGRAVASWLSVSGVGHSLGSSLLVGVGVGVLALAVMIGLALAVDPSLVARVRRARGVQAAAQETVP
ncbi:murein biosynthesis integral membrane protein MurJ [Terrabacter sp. MAHUQ-38]|uniref:murein biosynthesis integral membrane protein MurJ n=1 Tax=unclassified Terrabacter TaxID=2630222 RepID=UPI001CAA423E|nr:lipid II flippase MurJ [Terrabacter sp. MAHUQ-38]